MDEPVGAVGVGGVSGAWGVNALGLFAGGSYGDGYGAVAGGVTGLLYGAAGRGRPCGGRRRRECEGGADCGMI